MTCEQQDITDLSAMALFFLDTPRRRGLMMDFAAAYIDCMRRDYPDLDDETIRANLRNYITAVSSRLVQLDAANGGRPGNA
jgi:hypothetical protein